MMCEELTKHEKDLIMAAATAIYAGSVHPDNEYRGMHPEEAIRAAVDLVRGFAHAGLIYAAEVKGTEDEG